MAICTWQFKCSTVHFSGAGGMVCLAAFEFVFPWLSNIPLHKWVSAWMPIYTCCPVSYPGSDAWSAADTPAPSLTAAPAVLWEGGEKKMGRQSSTDLAAENPNSSNNASTHSTAHTLRHTHSGWSAYTALPLAASRVHSDTRSTLRNHLRPVCQPQPSYKAWENGHDRKCAGGRWLRTEYARSHKVKKCAVIHKATKDREWNWVLAAGRKGINTQQRSVTQFYVT